MLDRHLGHDAPRTRLRLVLVQQLGGRFQGYRHALRRQCLLVVPVVRVQAYEDRVVLAAVFLGVEPKLHVADALQRRVAARRIQLRAAGGRDRLVVTLLPLAFLEQAQRRREHALVLRVLFQAAGRRPVRGRALARLRSASQTLGRVLDLRGEATAWFRARRRRFWAQHTAVCTGLKS